MTKEDIIRMAEEASGGRQPDGWGVMLDHQQLERFAALIAAAEREACAKLCDAECNPAPNEGHVSSYQAGCYITAEFLAAAIRAREQEKREQTSLQRQLIDAGALEANPAGLKARKQK